MRSTKRRAVREMSGLPRICNPSVIQAQIRDARYWNASPELHNPKDLVGDVGFLTGDASRLYGNGSYTFGEIQPGQYGCVTGWLNDISLMPKGRQCGRPECPYCKGAKGQAPVLGFKPRQK
jgi:hypothetical protein